MTAPNPSVRRRTTFSLLLAAGGVTTACGFGRSRQQSAAVAPAGANAEGQSSTPPRPPLDTRLQVSTAGWKTDFSKHTVSLSEIISGGPGKDGIPPLDRPAFEPVAQASAWLRDQEPVIALDIGSEPRAYPLQILIWHEIVNDVVGSVPVTVTFCPLCNTAIVFDRRLDGTVHDFGVSGNLRHSDLIMWDRQTESWWQQATGEAIVGELAGKTLTMLPASIISWKEFRTTWPGGAVLSRDTGHRRAYGQNPYVGYDEVGKPPFLFRGPTDGRLPPMERVLLVDVPHQTGTAYAVYPFSLLSARRVLHDTVAGQPLVAFWAPGTASALDRGTIATSRDVGAAAAFVPELVETHGAAPTDTLTFAPKEDDPGHFRDEQTGSTWSVTGQTIAGALQGQRLRPLVSGSHFWFAAAAFRPEAELRLG
ncbi:MAG TPA: DUF3179 domain-containing protein [Chloroflexota bacterium]|nr:DUF3179 domain-containing protein [Chloroflexota bacterium]